MNLVVQTVNIQYIGIKVSRSLKKLISKFGKNFVPTFGILTKNPETLNSFLIGCKYWISLCSVSILITKNYFTGNFGLPRVHKTMACKKSCTPTGLNWLREGKVLKYNKLSKDERLLNTFGFQARPR